MAEAELQLSASQHQLTGTLKMAVPIETGQLVLARVVADYLQSHPDLKVDMELTNRVVDPITEGLDCIIRIGESDDTSLVSRRLWLTERLLCASPSYLERVGVPSHPVQLEEHERIFVRSSLLSPRWVFEREGERVLIEPKSRFKVNNITCAREAAKAGLALASLPAMLCREELASGALVPLLSEWRQPPVPIYLLCPERRFMPRKLRTFIDYLIERRDEYAIDRLI
ncbi:LysR family transcriptional regulator [Aeromonas schubertii]|uniref:LysR family transcriptional regulator n=1 Tax=Aeromonas schubertii TaxID=652 RepID=A0A0S2SIR3_9GAMM|nr:substrate binding domain-containing protein [Aeromonas schubertii]ALP41566.1 LysR family transcriptional regulator [Aeromonas schubertii]